MISNLSSFIGTYVLAINFVAHTLIFIGTLYVALHNRNLPQWHVTPLWYAGLCSLFTSISVVIQWAIGPEFPLSYRNVGMLGETLLNISIAAIAVIMLVITLKQDLRGTKNRK